MSVNVYNKTEDKLIPIAGGVVYAEAPIGAIIPYGGNQAPSGWLLCDGRAVSRNIYFDLYKVIGTIFGVGDSSNTFNVPDLRGKTLVGYNSSETEFNVIGKTGGEKTHTLTVSEIPSHSHTVIPLMHVAANFGCNVVEGSYTNSDGNYSPTTRTEATGGGQPHNNLQPYNTVNYIIKAKHTPVPADFMDVVNDTVDEAVTEKLHYNGRINTNVRTFVTSSQIHTFTASKTGLLKAYMHKSGGGYTARLFVNGVPVDQLSCYGEDSSGTELPWIENGGIDTTLSAFVKEGDVIEIDSDESNSASANSWYLYATVLQYKS